MMGSSCSSQRQSDLSSHHRNADTSQSRLGCGRMSGQGDVRRILRHSVPLSVPDHSIAALYSENDNYVVNDLGQRSPKPLAELATDALCRHLTLLNGELPPGLPQDVVDDILHSLIRHHALNSTTLRALRHCELRSLNLANCRSVSDEWLTPLSQAIGNAGSPPYEKKQVDRMDIEAAKPMEIFYSTGEDASACSTSSFVSANEDHPMEDVTECNNTSIQALLPVGIYGSETTATSGITLLDLRGSHHLTDQGLLQLTGLTHLEEARLDKCHSLEGRGLLAFCGSHSLHTLSLVECRRLTDEAVIHMSHLQSLECLYLAGSRCITDRSLVAIASICSLRSLDLSRCDLLTDEGLRNLESLVELEELNLGWCRQVTDYGVDCITRQPLRGVKLRVLNLARCPISSDSLEYIARLSGLEDLDLNGCTAIARPGWEAGMARLENLVSLNVSYCPNILRAGTPETMSNLKVLDLRYSGVKSSHLFKLSKLLMLEELNLDSCLVGDVGIAHLVDHDVCPNLKSLDLSDNDLTDAGMVKIAKFSKLVYLSLFYCNITNSGLRQLAGLEDLEVLNLDSRDITDEGLLVLRSLQKLKSLDIFSGRITDTGCGYISAIKSLESLELCGGAVGDLGCIQLARLENLMVLNLSQNERITNRGAAALAALTNLRALNLSNTKVTSSALRLFAGLVRLKSLALYGCRGLDCDESESILKLQHKLPNLKCLRMNEAAEHDGMYVAARGSDADTDSAWSGSGGIVQGSSGIAQMDDDEDVYSDYD